MSISSGANLAVLSGPDSLEFSPNGRILAWASRSSIELCDAFSGKPLASLRPSRPGIINIAFSPDNTYLAAAAEGGTVSLWDVTSGSLVKVIDTSVEKAGRQRRGNLRPKRARVNIDYHIDLEHHYYSVPYQLVGKEVDVRYTATTVEILYQGKRVASHAHSSRLGKHSTLPEHRPKAHQKYLEWTPSRIVEWAGTVGPFTAQLAEKILAERPHPEQGYRSCMGLIGLGRRYGKDRLEAAAQRAIHLQAHSYRSVKSILERGLDRQSGIESATLGAPVEHANIRGAGYYTGSLFEEVGE